MMNQILLLKKTLILFCVLFVSFFFIREEIAIAQTTTGSFVHGGLSRSYRLYVPAVYNSSAAVPLVLNLHGYGSNNSGQEVYGDFRPIADTANFIIVHPNGTLDGTGKLYWNCYGAAIDDVGFLSALIDTISSHYNIDQNRIYCAGLSNGGIMSYHLACALNNRIAAIASVTGSMTPSQKNSCSPSHPTPVMEIHGTADGTVPFNGSSLFIPIDSVLKFWSLYNNCFTIPDSTALPDINTMDGCTAKRFVFNGGEMGSTVELYKILGGGHSWPGAPVNIDVTNKDFSASAEIWRFFSKYKLDVLTKLSPVTDLTFSLTIYPNPTEGIFQLNSGKDEFKEQQIEIYNMMGTQVPYSIIHSENSSLIDISAQPEGLYFVTIFKNGQFTKGKIIKH